jgi:hypothetical protein
VDWASSAVVTAASAAASVAVVRPATMIASLAFIPATRVPTRAGSLVSPEPTIRCSSARAGR